MVENVSSFGLIDAPSYLSIKENRSFDVFNKSYP